MENTISVAEAKTALSECLRQVETGDPIIITRHGKPVAALVSAHDIEHLRRLRKAGPEKGLASIAGGWNGSEELVKAIKRSPRSGNRIVPDAAFE
jgi:prevent-host-death family protein